MIDQCPISSQDRLHLACTVTSRLQLFLYLKDKTDSTFQEEIYSWFLHREIEDLYGTITSEMEQRLQKMRDIAPLTQELLYAKHKHKRKILEQYHIYRPSLRYQIYRLTGHSVSLPDISLSRLVSYTVSHMKTTEQRERARQLTISLLKRQLEDALVATDFSDFFNQHLTFASPPRLRWTRLVLEIPSLACTSSVSFCSDGVDVDHPNGKVCARVKQYHLCYPNVFELSKGSQETLKTMLRGDLALTRVQHILDRDNPLPHWSQIVHLGSRKYFDKLAHVNCLRGIIGILPITESDRVAIDLLSRDLLETLLPDARRIYCGSHPKHLHHRFNTFVATDPSGILVSLVLAEESGKISHEKFMSMIHSRINMLKQKGFDFSDLVG